MYESEDLQGKYPGAHKLLLNEKKRKKRKEITAVDWFSTEN